MEMGWIGKSLLCIEVGSMEVFNWLENKGLRPWSMGSLFKEVESRISIIGNVSFSRDGNFGTNLASALAIAGMKRQSMFKAWW
ncbi:hypothetical protein J1N35_009136 [Gossypium stocksii]|uniref:Uncharacterized protein n=1 Tax=Gossypium stocksii TaxID=47602 RepID=A0A9D3WBR1_9ROSI|nr:hypothetical protein J1N35_009136 [Gossypium stocksii]